MEILKNKAKLLPAEPVQGISFKLRDILSAYLNLSAGNAVYGGNTI